MSFCLVGPIKLTYDFLPKLKGKQRSNKVVVRLFIIVI